MLVAFDGHQYNPGRGLTQSDPAVMPGVMQPGRLSQAQTAQPQNKN